MIVQWANLGETAQDLIVALLNAQPLGGPDQMMDLFPYVTVQHPMLDGTEGDDEGCWDAGFIREGKHLVAEGMSEPHGMGKSVTVVMSYVKLELETI